MKIELAAVARKGQKAKFLIDRKGAFE